jgi:hypothetical protein
MTVPIEGDRGYAFAEVTAGGVPLSELHLDTLGSRRCPGLSLCGEICGRGRPYRRLQLPVGLGQRLCGGESRHLLSGDRDVARDALHSPG